MGLLARLPDVFFYPTLHAFSSATEWFPRTVGLYDGSVHLRYSLRLEIWRDRCSESRATQTVGRARTVAEHLDLESFGISDSRDSNHVAAGRTSSRLHLRSTNCLRKLSGASDVLSRESSGTSKFISQCVQTPTARTVSSHFVALKLALGYCFGAGAFSWSFFFSMHSISF